MREVVFRIVVVGVGNLARGDDAVGRWVARQLQGEVPSEVKIYEREGEATALLQAVEGASMAFFVDACCSGSPAGTIQRFEIDGQRLPEGYAGVSTHGFGVGEAIELGRILGCLPKQGIVYAIEGAKFDIGAEMSPVVAAAAMEVVEAIRTEIAALTGSIADA